MSKPDVSQMTVVGIKNGVLGDNHRTKVNAPEPTPHDEILGKLLEKIYPISFRDKAELDEGKKLKNKHFVVIAIEELLKVAKANEWGICKRHDFIYLYNGAYWSQLDEQDLKKFLGDAAEKMGIEKFSANYFRFGDDLLKQFQYQAYLPTPKDNNDSILINLKNGTVEINPQSGQMVTLRQPDRKDFLTYQLPFRYDRSATAPRWQKYLDDVLPDKVLQKIMAEYVGSVFIKTSTLKLEKALILHGSGSNGKSVFFDVISALLGDENISKYTLESLTNGNGYYRAKIANKLLNYASEINSKMDTGKFKQLVSGEPIEARLPYGNPFIIKDYAKMMFNANELPTEVEHTHAFFRRFMIVPFEQVIPESHQDKELSIKIIQSELSGVFNWILAGLERVLKQGGYTSSDKITEQSEIYKQETDNVQIFISARGYEESFTEYTLLKELYAKYKSFCEADGHHPTAKLKFSKRLQNSGYKKDTNREGVFFYITQK